MTGFNTAIPAPVGERPLGALQSTGQPVVGRVILLGSQAEAGRRAGVEKAAPVIKKLLAKELERAVLPR